MINCWHFFTFLKRMGKLYSICKMDWIANAVQRPVSLVDDKDGGNLQTEPIKLSSLIWAHM